MRGESETNPDNRGNAIRITQQVLIWSGQADNSRMRHIRTLSINGDTIFKRVRRREINLASWLAVLML